ncbi:MAG: tolB, partial [Planctomycetaceae bacterium]|nr:tolB [Planctomycetaceae bacterium]
QFTVQDGLKSISYEEWGKLQMLLREQLESTAIANTKIRLERHCEALRSALRQENWAAARFHARWTPDAQKIVSEKLTPDSQLKVIDGEYLLLRWQFGNKADVFTAVEKQAETRRLGACWPLGFPNALARVYRDLRIPIENNDQAARDFSTALSEQVSKLPVEPDLPATLNQSELWFLTEQGEVLGKSFDSQEIQRVTMPSGKAQWLGWFRQGSELAIISEDQLRCMVPGKDVAQQRIFQFSSLREDFAITPDGSRCAWCKPHPPTAPELIVTNGAGQQLHSLGFGYDPEWFPDGQRLAHLTWDGSIWKIGIWDGEHVTSIAAPFHTTLSPHPTPSPDGNVIAFAMKADDDTRQIGLISLDGKQIRQVSHSGKLNTMPAFSPDGRYVAFIQTGEAGKHDLRVVDLESDEETRIAEDVALARPAWRRALKGNQ